MIDRVYIKNSYRYYRDHTEKKDLVWNYKTGSKPYNKIVNGLISLIMKKVLDGNDVILAGKLGRIGINGRKVEPIITENGEVKGIAPDWGETKKLQARDPVAKANKTIVYCFNEHSNGIRYKIFWSQKDVLITNKCYYNLSFSRYNRRELVRLIKAGKEYLVRDDMLIKDRKEGHRQNKKAAKERLNNS